MNILVTGAKGMVGTALCNNLKNIKDGKNKTRLSIKIDEIYEYDLDSTEAELDEYCTCLLYTSSWYDLEYSCCGKSNTYYQKKLRNIK